MMKNNRIVEFDLLRTIACLMVIFMHTPLNNEYAIRFLTNSINYMASPCIGLFFMISGALLLKSQVDSKKFLSTRLHKIIYPTLFWSLFYIIVSCYITRDGISKTELIKSILSIPFSTQGAGHLWFMYTLTGIYLLTPIMSKWINNSSINEVKFYLLLWCVTLCYPIICMLLEINETNTGILYYFSGYAGYYLLGYYLFIEHHKFKWKYLLPLLIISLITPVVCRLNHLELDWMSLFWYLSIFVVIMCVAWFKFILNYGHIILAIPLVRRLIISFSNLSFGVYFIHFFILRTILWNVDFINAIPSAPIQIILWSSLTILISYGICYGISYLPYSQYIIGYTKRK